MASDILPGSGGGRRGGMSGRTSGSGRGAGNDDDGEHPSPSRHRFDGRKLRQTVNNRLMATAAVDGMRRDVSRDTHDNTQTDYKASRESSASEVFESQKQALHEAQLLLQDTIENENDEDLLLPEDLDGAELPEERARRLFAAGVFDDPMSKKSSNLQEKLATKSAWSVEPLQPTEEDKMKQRVYEKVHLRKHRRRHAVHLYGDPDQFEELQLDSDVVKGEHHKFLKEMYGTQTGLEKTNKDGDNKTGTILAAVFGAGSSDPSSVPQVSPFQSPSKQSPGKNSRRMLSPGGLEDASPSATSIRASPGGSSVVSPSQNPLLRERADKRDDKIAPQDARARQVDIAAQAALAARLEHIPVTLRGCITPSEIDTPEGSRVVKINGGPKHCAVLLDVSEIIERILPRHREHAGRVLMLGGNEFGQLGVGDKFNRTTPAVLQTIRDTNGTGQGGGGRVVDHGGNHLGGHGVNNKRVVDIACGGMHTVCVTHDSSAAAFGTDRSGSCGQGESGRDQSFLLPRIIHWVSRDTMRVSAAACGDSHTLLLTVDGRVLSLGDGGFGKLGHGEDGFQDSLDDGKRFRHHTKPTRIKELDGLRIVSIACGKNHSACVTDSGLAYAWGKNTYGQLGTGSFHDQSTPHRAGHAEWHGGEVVSAVDHENDDESGTKNSATSKTFQLQERLLGKLEGANARFIPYGEVHRPFAQPTELQLETAALKREAKLGIRRVGDVGGDETNNSYNSEKSKSVTGATVKTKKYPVVQIAGGNSHTVFLSAAGRVYTCGSNLHGQLGMGEREPSQDVSSSPVPKLVSSLVNLRVTNVASGSDHVACRTALGVVYVWGGNFEGQLGDGTVADAHSPKPLIPELVEQQNTPPWKVRQIKGHPMFGLTCENVFACGTSTFAVVEGGQRVFVCGAGVPFEEGVVAGAGRRATQAPTDTATHTSTSTDSKPNLGDFRGGGANTPVTTFSKMLSTKLSDVENKRALVMESTVRMLTPDERSFDDLTSQMLAYAPYDEYVLVRVLNTVISEVIEKPAFHVMYGSLLERLVKFKCLKCPNSHFRRVILLAVEHAGVSMLKRQDGVMHARMLKTLGWARYQKWLTGEFQGLQKLGDGTQLKDSANLSYYDSIVDKKSYEDFRKFRDECKALQGLLRDLYEHRGVLLADDINNVAAGFPGSEHSVKIVSSETAWKKVTFFKGLARWRTDADDDETTKQQQAARAAATSLRSDRRSVFDGGDEQDDLKLFKQKGVQDDDVHVPHRGVDEAAWTGETILEEGPTSRTRPHGESHPYPTGKWETYFQEKRREANFLDPVHVGVDARDADPKSLARMKQEEAEEMKGVKNKNDDDDDDSDEDFMEMEARRHLGVDGSRVVERALASSSHSDNVVMTHGRAELLKHMNRHAGGETNFSTGQKAQTDAASLLEKTESGARAARVSKLEMKLKEMAARGVSTQHLEHFKLEAQTKPELGFTTQRDIDDASPKTKGEWRRKAFSFRSLDLEALKTEAEYLE